MRVLIALGGNAMTGPDGSATPQAQREAIARAMAHVATVVAAGHEVVLTHGNGPQVGNLLVKNELAAHVVPPVPLDWCGAQTQGTIGFTILDTLEPALAARGLEPPGRGASSRRTLVDPDDPGFATPTKPIGRFLPHDQAAAAHRARRDLGGPRRQGLAPRGRLPRAARGPRDPHPAHPARARATSSSRPAAAAYRWSVHADGTVHGVEAVIDKDLTAAVLARAIGADALVIATDVENAVLDFGTPAARARRPRAARARWRGMPRTASSRPARWAPRSRPPCGSSARAAGAASSPPSTGSPTPSPATSAPSSRTPSNGSRRPSTTAPLTPQQPHSNRKVTTVPEPIEVRKVPIHSVVRRQRARQAHRRRRDGRQPRHRRHRQDRGQRRRQRLHPDHRRPGVPRGARRQGRARPTRSSRSRSSGPAAPTASSARTRRSSPPCRPTRPSSPTSRG